MQPIASKTWCMTLVEDTLVVDKRKWSFKNDMRNPKWFASSMVLKFETSGCLIHHIREHFHCKKKQVWRYKISLPEFSCARKISHQRSVHIDRKLTCAYSIFNSTENFIGKFINSIVEKRKSHWRVSYVTSPPLPMANPKVLVGRLPNSRQHSHTRSNLI